MYLLKGGAVPIPRWILIFRAFQLFFALLTMALTAYALSINGGGPLQPPLIATIIIAILTVLPVLVLTTPLHLVQRKVYDPRLALLLDGFAALFWLAAFSALASYQDIFRYYGRKNSLFDFNFNECFKCRRAWRTGTAATVFAAIEFVLFLLTTLTFTYYYHCHLAGAPAPGFGRSITNKTGGAAAGTTATGAAASGTHGGVTAHEGEQHQMESPPRESPITANEGAGNSNTGTHGSTGQQQYPTSNQQHSDPPYPTDSPRQAKYAEHENWPNARNGTNPNPV